MDRQKRLERLQLISSLFDAAIEKPPDTWDAFLTSVCPDDADVRRNVKELLESFQGPVNPLKPAGVDLRPDTSPQEQPFFLVGRRLGSYWLKRVLSTGEAGVRYEALNTKTNAVVTVQVIPPPLANQREVMAQLRQDTARLSALKDTCFPQGLEIKKEDGHTLLITRPISGESLADRMDASGAQLWEEALPLFSSLLKVIRKAHHTGVIHRALSPDVIYLDQDTESGIRIDYFGPFVRPKAEVTTSIEPGTGYALRYHSPEHFEGLAHTDERSDQYSLGAIFYELLTGTVPLDAQCTGASAHQFITTHQWTQPDTFTINVPDGLAAIVKRMLAGDQTKRYRNVSTVLKALDDFSYALSPPDPTAPWIEVPAHPTPETETETPTGEEKPTEAAAPSEGTTDPPTPEPVAEEETETPPAAETPVSKTKPATRQADVVTPHEVTFESGDSIPPPRSKPSDPAQEEAIAEPEDLPLPIEPPVPVLAQETIRTKRTAPKVARLKRKRTATKQPDRSLSAQRRLERTPAPKVIPPEIQEEHERTRRRWAILALLFALCIVLFAIGLQLSKGQSRPAASRTVPFRIATPVPPPPTAAVHPQKETPDVASARLASVLPRSPEHPPRPTSSAPLHLVEQTNPEPIGGYGVIQREVIYPASQSNRKVTGTVIVELTIDASGVVQDPKVIQGLSAPFDQEAVRVLRHTRFRPARQGEVPVAATIRLPIQFSP